MSNPNIEAMYGLSPAQEGMLFHSVLEAEAGFYVTQLVCEVRRADVDTLVRAWQEVVNRHAIFRTAFAWKGVQRPLQVVGWKVTLPVVQEDWRGRPAATREAELAAWLEEDRRRGFDLARAPAMRLALLRIGEAEWMLVWSHHHVLLDGWSLPRVLGEVRAIYAALRRGETAAGAGLRAARPYQDYITWLGRQDLAAAESFWREMLAEAPRGRAPGGGEGRTDPTDGTDRTNREVTAMLTEPETAALQVVARSERLTLNTVVQGVWACVLAAETGVDDVVYGITVSGRPAELPGVEDMIGLFINTLPMRVRIRPGMTLGRWLAGLQARLTELRRFEHTPLVKVNGWAGRATGEPLFETLFVFENYPVGELPADARGGADFEIVAPRVREKTNYPLTIAVAPGARLAIKLAFDPARHEATAMERWVARLVRGLRALPAAVARPVGELDLLTEAEREVLAKWGVGERATGEAPLVVDAVAAQAARTPERVALSMGGERVTYAELMARADAVAARLVAAGVRADEPVGVLLERSTRLLPALLGVWRAGAAYAPLEADAPAERVRGIVVENRIRAIVTEAAPRRRWGDVEGVAVVEVEEEAPSTKLQVYPPLAAPEATRAPGKQQGSKAGWRDGAWETARPAAEQVAYVLFTSGSTGRPKGVAVSHGALANHMRWFNAAYGFSAEDVVLQKTPVTFDASVWECWAPLMTGGRLELAPPGAHQDAAQVAATMREAGVTVLQGVPSLLAVLAEEPGLAACETLRIVFSGGEALTPAVRDAWWAALRRPLVNLYGPTETTIECATWTCGEADGGAAVPIGRAAPGCRLHVLDASLRPVAPGVPGELHVGGAQVARGYWGRPELTAERFVPDPFSGEPAARLYRTGDLVRWRDDGVLEYLGREDGQVKVRGQRVELGEVEAALAALPGVRQAVAAVRAGELIGYVQWADATAGGAELAKVALARRVPAQLVPSRWVRMSEWPRLPSGKIDRRALPAPETVADGGHFVAARTDDERAVAAIWRSVLGAAGEVGATEDFFALGGHSLTAMQVMARVRRELKVELPVRALFEAPTVEAFARVVAAAREPAMEETTL